MITDQAATEQTRYLAAPVCTPRSADALCSTVSAAKLIIICRCVRQLGATPSAKPSQQTAQHSRRSQHYADRIHYTWITLFAKPKSKLFFPLFFVSTALVQKTCSVELCCKPACSLTKITLYNCRATANRTVL